MVAKASSNKTLMLRSAFSPQYSYAAAAIATVYCTTVRPHYSLDVFLDVDAPAASLAFSTPYFHTDGCLQRSHSCLATPLLCAHTPGHRAYLVQQNHNGRQGAVRRHSRRDFLVSNVRATGRPSGRATMRTNYRHSPPFAAFAIAHAQCSVWRRLVSPSHSNICLLRYIGDRITYAVQLRAPHVPHTRV